jgi:hypothetical protein
MNNSGMELRKTLYVTAVLNGLITWGQRKSETTSGPKITRKTERTYLSRETTNWL